jgi:hypothetical protein
MAGTKLVRVDKTDPASSSWGLTWTVNLGKIDVSVESQAGKYLARLRAAKQLFEGRGPSPITALNDLTAVITQAGVKRSHHGRASDRVKVAVTLLRGG